MGEQMHAKVAETGLNNQVERDLAGGESGPGVRPCPADWLRSLRDQCGEAGIPFFLKQLGSVLGRDMGCRDRKGGDMAAWSADLRIREMPR